MTLSMTWLARHGVPLDSPNPRRLGSRLGSSRVRTCGQSSKPATPLKHQNRCAPTPFGRTRESPTCPETAQARLEVAGVRGGCALSDHGFRRPDSQPVSFVALPVPDVNARGRRASGASWWSTMSRISCGFMRNLMYDDSANRSWSERVTRPPSLHERSQQPRHVAAATTSTRVPRSCPNSSAPHTTSYAQGVVHTGLCTWGWARAGLSVLGSSVLSWRSGRRVCWWLRNSAVPRWRLQRRVCRVPRVRRRGWRLTRVRRVRRVCRRGWRVTRLTRG